MRMKVAKFGLTLFAFLLLMPMLLTAQGSGAPPCDPYSSRCQVTAEESGGAASYLLGVGVTCLGGVFISSRLRRLQ